MHLYSAMGSAIGIQRRWWRQLRLSEQVGFEFAFESLKNVTGSNVSRQRVPCLWCRDRECSSSEFSSHSWNS